MIRNAATPHYLEQMAPEGLVPNINHDHVEQAPPGGPGPNLNRKGAKLPKTVTRSPEPLRRSHHLTRGDGTPYWEHNAGR